MQELIERGKKQALALYENEEYAKANRLLSQGIKTFVDEDGYFSLLGMVESRQGKHREALAHFKQANEINPSAEHLNNIGLSWQAQGNTRAAIDHFKQAIDGNEKFIPAYSNLADEYQKKGNTEEAITLLKQAVTIDPSAAYAWFNLGNMHGDNLWIEAAVAAHQKAVELEPENPAYQFNYANGLLLLGRWKEGWEHFKHRGGLFPQFHLKQKALMEVAPAWNGQDLTDKRLYLYCVEGDGDFIQLIRFAKVLEEMGATVIVETPPNLQELFVGVAGISEIAPVQNKYKVRKGEPNKPFKFELDMDTLPTFDFHCELAELPRLLEITPDNIPDQPYIKSQTQHKPLASKTKLHVGLCWGGNPIHANDSNRSCPLKHFEPLSTMPNVMLFCLQKDQRQRHWEGVGKVDLMEGANFDMSDATESFTDYDSTAYWISQLDIVVTVDTSIAHLAGAMGKPCFLLLPFAPDWRWMLKTERTPWYPSMFLFRQQKAGDWEAVIKNVVVAIDSIT